MTTPETDPSSPSLPNNGQASVPLSAPQSEGAKGEAIAPTVPKTKPPKAAKKPTKPQPSKPNAHRDVKPAKVGNARARSSPKSVSSAADVAAPAVWMEPKTLTPWTKNPKPIEPKDVREMKRSIRRFGFGAPIVARAANREIIEGHLRHVASLALRLERVPVRLLDISADEAHLLAIAAWKFEHRREADEKEVADLLDDLEDRGVDIELGTGFDDKEIDKLLAKGDGDDGEDLLNGDGSSGASSVRGHTRRSPTTVYRIVVDCKDAKHQGELLESFAAQGLACKTLAV